MRSTPRPCKAIAQRLVTRLGGGMSIPKAAPDPIDALAPFRAL
jgi:hypothetical protein